MRTVNDKPRYGRTVMTLVCCVALCLVQMCSSFMLPSTPTIASPTFHHVQSSHRALNRASSTALSERRWNFNEGGGPFGLKKNAEIWNGRVAQVRSKIMVACLHINSTFFISISVFLVYCDCMFVCRVILNSSLLLLPPPSTTNSLDVLCLCFFARNYHWKGCGGLDPRWRSSGHCLRCCHRHYHCRPDRLFGTQRKR